MNVMVDFLNRIDIKLTFFSLAFLLAGMILMGYLKCTMARRFEKLFYKVKPINGTAIRRGNAAGRFGDYLNMVAFYWMYQKNKNSTLYKLYNGYNFPGHVSRLEFIVTRIFWICVFTAVISMAISAFIRSILETHLQQEMLPLAIHISGWVALCWFTFILIFGYCVFIALYSIKQNLLEDSEAAAQSQKCLILFKFFRFSVLIGFILGAFNILLYYHKFGHL